MTDPSTRAGAAIDESAHPVAAACAEFKRRPAERPPGATTPAAKETSKEWQKLQSQFDAVFGRDA